MQQLSELRPRTAARITGALYLLTVLAGVVAQALISDRLVVTGDAVATATNFLRHAPLVRLGFASYMVEMLCQIAMTATLYELLKPAGRGLSLVAALVSLAGCVIKALGRIFFLAPLVLLSGSHAFASFSTAQLQTLALFSLALNDLAAGMALVFFGVNALAKGVLLLRSSFLPRALGVVALAGGLGWLSFLYPPLADRLLPVVMVVGLLGAAVQIFWLLAYGVDEARWRQQAATAAASIWR